MYRLLVAFVALNVVLFFQRPNTSMRPLLTTLLITIGVAAVLDALLSHSGRHVLFAFPNGIPVIGGIVTIEALVYGACVGVGIAAAVLALAPCSVIMEPHDVIDTLPQSLRRLGIILVSALTIVPGISRSFVAIGDAQRMRGWKPKTMRSWHSILVPVALTAFEDSAARAEAMEARGFGSGSRTRYRPTLWRKRDSISVVVFVGAVVAFLSTRSAEWYPFPYLTFPVVSVLAVCACLTMGTPIVLWQSRR